MTKHWPSDRIGKAKREAEFQMDKDIFKEIIETKKKVDDLNNRINDGFIVEKIETEEEAEIINEALKILGQDFRLRPGDRLKFIKNGKLFYRHFSSENDHGVWERPFNVSDLSVCGKIVDLCEELFKHQINNKLNDVLKEYAKGRDE